MRLIYVQRVLLFIFMICTFLLPNCSDQQRSAMRSKPSAIGTPGQTLVIIDPDLWASEVGDSLRYNLAAAYPLLPAPEPILDLTPIQFDEMVSIKFQWKNIIFVSDLDSESSEAKFTRKTIGEEAVADAKSNVNYNYATQNDRWAKNQQIAFIFAHGKKNLGNAVAQRAEKIISKVEESDLPMITATTYSMGQNNGIISRLRENLLIDLRIPGDYRTALEKDGHYWLRKETRKADLGLLIKKIPYEGDLRVDEATILKLRNEFGKKYITSTADDSYMTTDMKNLTPPVYFNQTTINGNYAIEARGVWKMQNGFMGGAFISYLVYHEPSQSLVFMDGFVYAPEQSKRKYLQRLKCVMDSLQFLGKTTAKTTETTTTE